MSLAIIKKFIAKIPYISILACLIYLIVLTQFSPVIFRSSDTLWIMKLGNWILDNGVIPTHNIFGEPFPELVKVPWVCYQWLFAVFTAALYKIAGYQGIVWGMVSLVAATITISSITLYLRGFKWFPDIFIAIIVNSGVIICYLVARPILATLFFSSLLGLLLVFKRKPIVQWLFLPILFILWANTHLGFIFGLLWLLLEAIITLKQDASWKLSLSFLISFLTTGINPYGFYLYKYLFSLGTSPNMNSSILELRSIDFHVFPWVLIWMIIGILTFGYSWNENKVRLSDRVIWLICLSMTLFSVRHITYLWLFMPIIYAGAVHKFFSKFTINDYFIGINKAIISLLFFIFIGLFLSISKFYPAILSQKDLSDKFIQYINKTPPSNLVLAKDTLGSELIYFTRSRAYIDTRFDMYGDEYFGRMGKFNSFKNDWQDLAKKEKIKYILCTVKQPEKIEKIRQSNNWKEIYTDQKVVFFKKQ